MSPEVPPALLVLVGLNCQYSRAESTSAPAGITSWAEEALFPGAFGSVLMYLVRPLLVPSVSLQTDPSLSSQVRTEFEAIVRLPWVSRSSTGSGPIGRWVPAPRTAAWRCGRSGAAKARSRANGAASPAASGTAMHRARRRLRCGEGR